MADENLKTGKHLTTRIVLSFKGLLQGWVKYGPWAGSGLPTDVIQPTGGWPTTNWTWLKGWRLGPLCDARWVGRTASVQQHQLWTWAVLQPQQAGGSGKVRSPDAELASIIHSWHHPLPSAVGAPTQSSNPEPGGSTSCRPRKQLLLWQVGDSCDTTGRFSLKLSFRAPGKLQLCPGSRRRQGQKENRERGTERRKEGGKKRYGWMDVALDTSPKLTKWPASQNNCPPQSNPTWVISEKY